VVAHCGDEPPTEIRAKVVVDASGRATVIGKQLGLR
jgi:flavin-dependent dehydrogenase